MSGLRVVVVTRRFWPVTDGTVTFLTEFATELQDTGHCVQIVTAQWDSSWPTEVEFRELPVTRLAQPAMVGWGTFRYMRALSRWLRDRQHNIDVVYVANMRYDAHAVLGSLANTTVPVVLRAEASGQFGDAQWYSSTRFGNRVRSRCLNASAFVTPTTSVLDELRTARFATNQIQLIPPGTKIETQPTAEEKAAAREAVAEVNHDLAVNPETPVAVAIVALNEQERVADLVRAWKLVVQQIPDARLWIVGDGPAREDLFELILDLDLRECVFIPGPFDETSDLLAAADLFLSTSPNEANIVNLLKAMTIGVPVVVASTSANQDLVQHEEHGVVVESDSASIAAGSVRQLQQTILAKHYAEAARQRVAKTFSIEAITRQHVELFESLV